MAQADPDFDWTTAQPVEEDETSATLTATTFGQRSMPAPTQGPVNIDTEFDWKTATLDEPFDPATAQPISEQEEQQFYQDLEVASRDPQRILTNTEHSLLYDHRQQQDDAVARFFQGAEDVPGNLLSLGMDAGTELRENWFENMFRPDRFAARNLATGMEIGRKAGVQLLQLVNWGQNKVADTIQRGNANDAKMREIAAAVPKTGNERVDGDNVMAAIAKARDEGVFEETPFGPDKEQDYERYLQQNSYARSHAGNITEAAMGGKTMTFPNEQTTVLGQQPMQAVSTIGAMGLDITNALPMGAGIFSKLRVLRRLSRVTGMPLPAVERGLAGVADGMEDFGSRVAARVTDKTGLSKTQQVASLAAVSGGAGLLAANTDGMDGVLLPVAAVSGIVPAYKLVGGTIRKTSQAAGTSAMVLREMRAGNIGAVRQAAADDLLRTGTVPPQYAAYMRPYANGVESTLGRVAKNPDNPEITRKLARLADGSGVTQAVRFADDAVSSGIAATLASTPFALLAPDAEQAGAIVGGAATLGTFAGPFAGAFGRSSSRKDADIARMLIDVHAVNGDVPALISLGRDRLGQIAGMQGVVAGKTDFVTLRASDYRANVDVRATGNETGAGVFIEKASNGTARIFINVGEPASMDGKVRVRDRGDGVREVRVRGNDGRTEFIAAPKGRRLLVNDGDTVKAGQQVVDYMPPSRSMPHEIAHAILTSDILDGDIRTDMRNYVTQVYGEDGIKARGREYMAQIVDGDIMFGTHEGAVALTPEEVADVRSGKRTMSDVMKGKPVEAAERDALIDARIDEYNQRSREKGGNDYDWARDEVTAEQFAGEAKGIDFRGIRAGGPKVLESALATSARVLEVLGAKFDRTTGKPLDNPSVLFRDNPLFQSPVLRKRMIEHVRAYNDLLAGLEDAGKRETRGTKVSVDGTPDSAARSPHTKMRPDPDKGGQVGNEFLYVDETGKTQWRSPSEVRAREGSRTSQANTMYNPSRILAPNSTEFGRRTTDSGRTIVSGPTLPAQFDHFVHFPKWMREFARVLEASRERGMTFIADYNAIGDGKDGVYRVRNRGDIRAIQREVAFVGWELTGNKHLKTVLMDLNAFRASAMKAINNGELGIFNNDMQVIEADLRTYLGNHRNGLPGEAGIGQAKRDMLNGLIGTGTAVQRKANPLFSDLNPRGSVRSFRLDRYNDLTPTGREGLSFDYDKINNNRMPQQIPRSAQGMPDVAASGRGDGMPDGDYMAAVERGNENAARKIMEDAIKPSLFFEHVTKGKVRPFWHHKRTAEDFTTFRTPAWFSKNKEYVQELKGPIDYKPTDLEASQPYFLTPDIIDKGSFKDHRVLSIDGVDLARTAWKGKTWEEKLPFIELPDRDQVYPFHDWQYGEGVLEQPGVMDAIKEQGYQIIHIKERGFDTYAVLDPSIIKPADAVVRDGEGNVVPPSQRFGKPSAAPRGQAMPDAIIDRSIVPAQPSTVATYAPSDRLPPNTALVNLVNNDGQVTALVGMPYDGTPEGLVRAQAQLDEKIAKRYEWRRQYTKSMSQRGGTDAEGNPAYVVSPNLKRVAAVGTPQARYILGDLSADPGDAPALPRPKQADTSSQEPAGMALDDINRELDNFMMSEKKLTAKQQSRQQALLAEVEKRAGKGMTRLPPMPEFYGPRKELPR